MKRILVSGPIFNTPSGPSGQGGKLYTKLKEEGYTVYKRSHHRNKIIRVLDTLFFVLFHSRKYDIIVIQMFSNMAFIVDYFVVNLAVLLNKKTIPVIRGGAFVEFYKRYPKFVGGVLKKCTMVTSPSHFIAEYFKTIKLEVINVPNFIETDKFPYNWEPKTEPKILWVRAFNDIYKPELAIKVIYNLKKEFPEISLTMVGPDQGKLAYCKELIKELNLENTISLTGPISNDSLTDYYSSHSIYINTTSYESFGVAVIEAACSGIPIVSTRIGEIPYLWVDGEDMLQVEDKNEEAFTQAVKQLLLNKDLQLKLSKNASAKANNYSWDNVKMKWNSLLKEEINNG